MSMITTKTQRMELIAGTAAMGRAEIESCDRLGQLLNARVPGAWPPEFNSAETAAYFVQKLEADPAAVGWWCWYFVLTGPSPAERIVVGNGGFKGAPADGGTVELGYSLLREYQGAGLGTEAVRGLVAWAFRHPEVKRVIAETLPELPASIRVLEKLGFSLTGAGSEEGVIRFELPRSRFEVTSHARSENM